MPEEAGDRRAAASAVAEENSCVWLEFREAMKSISLRLGEFVIIMKNNKKQFSSSWQYKQAKETFRSKINKMNM